MTTPITAAKETISNLDKSRLAPPNVTEFDRPAYVLWLSTEHVVFLISTINQRLTEIGRIMRHQERAIFLVLFIETSRD